MKKAYKTYLFLTVSVIVLFIVRETMLCDFNYFTAKTHSDSDYRFSEKSLTFEVSENGLNQNEMQFEKQAYILISENDTILKSQGYGNPIVWKIEKLEMDNGVFPLYKEVKFYSKISCLNEIAITKLSNNKLRSIQTTLNATIDVFGNSEIIGFSSISNNKEIVKTAIGKVVEEKTKKILKEMDIKYEI